jgi:hypothetical protein
MALALAPAAGGAPPLVDVHASPQLGLAPLESTLTASGDAASHHWEVNGVAVGDGASLRHIFPAGHHEVALVATSASGEVTRQTLTVSAFSLTLSAPRVASYKQRIKFRVPVCRSSVTAAT